MSAVPVEQSPIPGVDRADLEADDFGEPEGSIDDNDDELSDFAKQIGTDIDGEEPAEADAESAAETDEPDEEADAETPDFESKAQEYDAWTERWNRDPAGFMSIYYNAMTDVQKAAFVAQNGFAPGTAPEAEPVYEAQSEIEALYLNERKQTQTDRKVLAELPGFAKNVEAQFGDHNRFIHDVSIQGAVHDAKLDFILDFLDQKLPDFDRAAVDKALSTGKVTYADAVKKHYTPTLKKAVVVAKQTAKARPTTPANASNSSRNLSDVKSMVEIFRAYGNS